MELTYNRNFLLLPAPYPSALPSLYLFMTGFLNKSQLEPRNETDTLFHSCYATVVLSPVW